MMVEQQVVQNVSNVITLDALRSNPMIQQLVEECWPNEVCVIGTVRKRATFDKLSLGQFVIGFVTNVFDTHHVETQWNMLNELEETAKLAENISCPIARGVFATSVLKVEEESITWSDSYFSGL